MFKLIKRVLSRCVAELERASRRKSPLPAVEAPVLRVVPTIGTCWWCGAHGALRMVRTRELREPAYAVAWVCAGDHANEARPN